MTIMDRPVAAVATARQNSERNPPAASAAERRLAGPAGFLLARPWLDRVTTAALRHLFFPMSRLWAAADVARGSVERFYAAVPLRSRLDDGDRLRAVLAEFESARATVEAVETEWERAFFGATDPGTDRLLVIERARRHARHRFNAMRGSFLFLVRRGFAPVTIDIATPDLAAAVYGPALADLAPFTAPPAAMPDITTSRAIPAGDITQYWIRFASPSARLADTAWARVYAPRSVANPATVIFGHGICVEFDHWDGMIDDAANIAARGLRVIRPEAPFHGRRCPPGQFGGERTIGTFPLGGLDSFLGATQEWAVLADFARRTSTGPLAMGGSSLGALTAQLTADRARDWPERLQPQALLLVTHCARFAASAFEGDLSSMFGDVDLLRAKGWTRELTDAYLGLLDPKRGPVVAGDRIVSVLGRRDRITPFAGGLPLHAAWGLPAGNTFVWDRGHFTVPMTMLRDTGPLDRFAGIMAGLA